MKKLILQAKEELEEELDNNFPKGKTKFRGEALMLFAKSIRLIENTVKAFGGCEHCFGKGYGTQTVNYGEVKGPTMHFCKCSRGKDLKKLVGKFNV